MYCRPLGTRERHWEHVGEHDWEQGNTVGNIHGDKGMCEGTIMGTSGYSLRDMCIGESWIWEQLILVMFASMHASITCIMHLLHRILLIFIIGQHIVQHYTLHVDKCMTLL